MLIKNEESDSNIHLDFVPMVDVLFNLLIFFLLATSLKQAEREMQIALPAAQSGGPISAALRDLIINVDKEGQIIVNGRRIQADDLRVQVKAAVAVNPNQKVVVRADRGTLYANVVRVLDICKGNGIKEPFLDTILQE